MNLFRSKSLGDKQYVHLATQAFEESLFPLASPVTLLSP